MIVLYPSYSFETLSSDRTAEEAREVLAAWSAVFHPALLEKFNEIPRWESASIPPYDVSEQPLLIPPCCESFMNEEWFEQQENGSARLVRNLADRTEILSKLLEMEGLSEHGFDQDFVADFMALGLAYFLADLLVQQLHYSSMMDDAQLTTQVFDAIKKYRLGEREAANDHLKQAFEAVCQSKEYFYPVQTYFVDLTLVAETTIGESLRTLLENRDRVDLFLPSKLLQKISETEPETFETLRTASESGKVRFVIDDTEEKSLLLLPILDIADRVLEGLSVFREKLNVSPTIFGKLQTGLNPMLPQILKLTGMRGAVHFAPLDGWHLKDDAQSKMIWQGVDGTKLDALIRYPLNASSDLDFFDLAQRLGETINNDHAPTAVFASFPGADVTTWLDALRRMDRFSSGLGSFTPIDQYFDDTPQCGGVKKLDFDRYPANELVRAVNAGESDPISYWNRIHAESVRRNVDGAFETILTLLGRKITDRPLPEQCAEALTGRSVVSNTASNRTGVLLMNPWSFPRRAFVDVSDWPRLPEESDAVVLARGAEDRKEIVVDIPPMGFAFVEPGEETTEKPSKASASLLGRLGGVFSSGSGEMKSDPPLIRHAVEDLGQNTKRSVYVLENELFEAKIDADTGMLRSIFTDNYRFNRISRQLGFRMSKEQRAEDPRSEKDPNRGYAVMTADEITIDRPGPVTGRLEIRGRLLLPDGAESARFVEIVTIRRRSRLLEFDLSLEPIAGSGAKSDDSPWDSYFGIRYAWNDNTVDLRGGLGDGVTPLSGTRLQSPRFVDLRGEKRSLTFFSEGLPFHRTFGERQLDTLLSVRGETAMQFRTGIGIDLRYPAPVSLEFLVPKDVLTVPVSDKPNPASAWLFQVEAKNVVALHWEPVFHDGDPARPIGFRTFLLETEGRRANFSLQSFRPPKKAEATDLLGGERKEFKLAADAVLVDMHPHELLPLTVLFERS